MAPPPRTRARPLYSSIARSLWVDERFLALSAPKANARFLYMHLRTRACGAFPGLDRVSLAEIAEGFGWSLPATRRELDKIIAAGLAQYDAGRRLIYLPEALLDNVPHSINGAKSIGLALRELPICDLTRCARASAEELLRSIGRGSIGGENEFLRAFSEGAGDAVATPTPRRDPTVLHQEEEKDEDQEEERGEEAVRPPAAGADASGDETGDGEGLEKLAAAIRQSTLSVFAPEQIARKVLLAFANAKHATALGAIELAIADVQARRRVPSPAGAVLELAALDLLDPGRYRDAQKRFAPGELEERARAAQAAERRAKAEAESAAERAEKDRARRALLERARTAHPEAESDDAAITALQLEEAIARRALEVGRAAIRLAETPADSAVGRGRSLLIGFLGPMVSAAQRDLDRLAPGVHPRVRSDAAAQTRWREIASGWTERIADADRLDAGDKGSRRALLERELGDVCIASAIGAEAVA